MYRKISAHYILTGNETPIKNGVITVNESGKILEISSKNRIEEISGLEFYNGVLVPGFVNVHCHLELSHLKNKIEQKTGLPKFIDNIRKYRLKYKQLIDKSMLLSDNEMFNNGIVAVGDISNVDDSIEIKQNSKIKYHTFLELFGTNPQQVNAIFERALQFANSFKKSGLSCSVTPHAPYSVVPALFAHITKHLQQNKPIMSIHNQECRSENELYENKTGQLYNMFLSQNIDLKYIPITGKSSLQSILANIDKKISTILVHNTFTKKQDIEAANLHFDNLYWCLCPNANLYIEDRLPDIPLLLAERQNICIGTDSLASNTKLSVFEELKTISNKYPEIPVNELIKWATINGAKALELEENLGSLEQGKTPGINLIENFNFQDFQLIDKSEIRKLV